MKRKKEMEPYLLRRNRQRIRKTPLKSTISEGFCEDKTIEMFLRFRCLDLNKRFSSMESFLQIYVNMLA